MSTTITIDQGSQWDRCGLVESACAIDPDITTDRVIQYVDDCVRRFRELCEEAGDASIDWSPSIGEVYAQRVESADWSQPGEWVGCSEDIDLEGLRDQATGEIYQELADEVMAQDVQAEDDAMTEDDAIDAIIAHGRCDACIEWR